MEHVPVRREFVARALVTACPIGSSDAYEVMQGAHSNGFSLVGIFGQEVLPLDFTLLFHHFINSVLPLWKQETRAFEKGFLGDVLAQSVFWNWSLEKRASTAAKTLLISNFSPDKSKI